MRATPWCSFMPLVGVPPIGHRFWRRWPIGGGVWALNQRGHGDSIRSEEYTFEVLEQDFRGFVDGSGLDKFFLVAHSMGGTVGWLFTRRHRSGSFSEGWSSRTPLLRPIGTPTPKSRTLRLSRSATTGGPAPAISAVKRSQPSWWTNIGKVTSPTLMIAGSATDDDLQDLARRLPNGELIVIDTGHWIHETQPAAFIAAIRTFLED